MAPRRRAWTLSETQRLIEQHNTPIQELVNMFRHSKASIERKLTRLRAQGKIGNKTPDVVKEAYRLRHVKDK